MNAAAVGIRILCHHFPSVREYLMKAVDAEFAHLSIPYDLFKSTVNVYRTRLLLYRDQNTFTPAVVAHSAVPVDLTD